MNPTEASQIELKGFESTSQKILENEIKTFLKSNDMQSAKVVDIKYSCFFSVIGIGIPSYTAMIIYTL